MQGNLVELAEILDGAEDKDVKKLAERMPLAYDAHATVVTEYRIPIIHMPSADQIAQLLVMLVNKSLREGKATGPLLRKIKKENPIYYSNYHCSRQYRELGKRLQEGCLKNSHTP